MDTLETQGELPDAISKNYNLLSYLFHTHNPDSSNMESIIRVAADLGHYIADAHVPLHTTQNYDGQYSGQTGIHAIWETHVYELTHDDWIPQKVNATYIDDVDSFAETIILKCHSLVYKVLESELNVRLKEDAPSKWRYRTRGRTLDLIPTPGFCKEYSEALDDMVEIRFNESANAISSAWCSAWVDAGSPELNYSIKVKNESMNAFQDFRLKLKGLLSDVRSMRQQMRDKRQP